MPITKEQKIILFAAFAARFPIEKKELKQSHFSSKDIQIIDSLSIKFQTNLGSSSSSLNKTEIFDQLKNIQSANDYFNIIFTLQVPLALHEITYKNIGKSNISVADTILLNAIKNNDVKKTIQLIKESANPNAIDFDDRSALCIACINNNAEIVTLLLEHKANPNLYDHQKMTPVHYCAGFGFNSLIEILKSHGAAFDMPENINAPSPLFFALSSNHLETVDLLMAKGHPINSLDPNGHTLFHHVLANYRSASQQNNLQMKTYYAQHVKCLLQYNIDINQRFENDELKDYFLIGFTHQIQYQKLDEKDYELITLFQQKGYDPSKHNINNEGYTVQGYLFEYKNERLLKIFNLIPEGYSVKKIAVGDGKYMATFVRNGSQKLENGDENILSQFEQLLFQAIAESYAVSDTQEQESATDNSSIFQEQPQNKIKLIDEILSAVKNCQEFVAKKTKSSVPTWLSSINTQSLSKLTVSTLSELQNHISEWKNNVARRLLGKQKTNPNALFTSTITNEPKQIIIDAIYENTITFNPTIMKEIEGSENAHLLMPLNNSGDIDLNIINNSGEMNTEEREAFERILETPRQSIGNYRQPGIRFFIGNYFCNININGSQEQRQIVGELKISNSDSRIALYPLHRSGNGPLVLALGPFIPRGFHETQKKTVFQAHPITLNENTGKKILARKPSK